MEAYIEGQKFEKIDFTSKNLAIGEYENCIFTNCDFANSDLSRIKFIDCEFVSCNLSLAKTIETTLGNVIFKHCKLLGLRFETCNDFGLLLSFEHCKLDNASFYRTKLKKTVFKSSQIREVDFTETDLTGAVFDNCDLEKTVFENTMIEKADFRTSFHYSIDPERNKIKKAKFSLSGIVGLLNKYDIEIK
jgi:fluoroquinolone resistance protein